MRRSQMEVEIKSLKQIVKMLQEELFKATHPFLFEINQNVKYEIKDWCGIESGKGIVVSREVKKISEYQNTLIFGNYYEIFDSELKNVRSVHEMVIEKINKKKK